jgi:DNA-binding LytR/AlgR family response regulator
MTGKLQAIRLEDIIMIRGDGTYSWIYFHSGEQVFTSRTVKYWVNKLKSSQLLRVHRSYLVHCERIDDIRINEMNIHMAGGLTATIARSKKGLVRQLVKSA